MTLQDVNSKQEPVELGRQPARREPADRRPKKSEEQRRRLAAITELVQEARANGDSLTGPSGLLKDLTKMVLEVSLEEEMTEHLGHGKHEQPAQAVDDGEGTGHDDRSSDRIRNVRNGSRTKTVLTDNVGKVEIQVPRDRAGTFEPVIVPKHARKLGSVEQVVLSLTAKGLTTGEISAHLEEIYAASVSKDTISRITDRITEQMNEWLSRPLEAVYAAIFIDAIVRHEAPCVPSGGERPPPSGRRSDRVKLRAA
ncbi:hypothetical protein EFY87_19930 [Flexivirga caeni]|uniref:Mutator family transposase n=1 Tax=Flexivirga caeni TaxID=2294115 RepID=A0A3M9LT61_9MICO|nr:hypothetical protein EFY87_19930 [Flexivirga caeni]